MAMDNARAWSKLMTRSDAQQDTQGAKMPFLRFTAGDSDEEYTTYFRDVFFSGLQWNQRTSNRGHAIEEALIDIDVTILGNNLGVRRLRLDHDPRRFDNNHAPTTHLHYDDSIRLELEAHDTTDRPVRLVQDVQGDYRMIIG